MDTTIYALACIGLVTVVVLFLLTLVVWSCWLWENIFGAALASVVSMQVALWYVQSFLWTNRNARSAYVRRGAEQLLRVRFEQLRKHAPEIAHRFATSINPAPIRLMPDPEEEDESLSESPQCPA